MIRAINDAYWLPVAVRSVKRDEGRVRREGIAAREAGKSLGECPYWPGSHGRSLPAACGPPFPHKLKSIRIRDFNDGSGQQDN